MAIKRLVTGFMKTRADAEIAVQRILNCGYTRGEISVIMNEATCRRHFGIESGIQAPAGAGVRSVGGAMGAIIAAITAMGTRIVLPGIGLIVGGPITAALSGAGAGGATDSVIGALIGAGIPDYRAELYESALHNGGILIGVYVRSQIDAEMLEEVFEEFVVEQIRVTRAADRLSDSFA